MIFFFSFKNKTDDMSMKPLFLKKLPINFIQNCNLNSAKI